jgi:Ca2+-binding EF-hand superfamily protein
MQRVCLRFYGVPKEAIQTLKKKFDSYDLNNDGNLTLEEAMKKNSGK